MKKMHRNFRPLSARWNKSRVQNARQTERKSRIQNKPCGTVSLGIKVNVEQQQQDIESRIAAAAAVAAAATLLRIPRCQVEVDRNVYQWLNLAATVRTTSSTQNGITQQEATYVVCMHVQSYRIYQLCMYIYMCILFQLKSFIFCTLHAHQADVW